MKKLTAVPLSLKETNAFIAEHHRHHVPVKRDKFRVGCELNGKLVGVINVGNPVARKLCDGYTLEVTRMCSDGTKDVCSFLYSRAARIAKEMGYRRIITYILINESGVSLKSSGWHKEAETKGSSWNTPGRPRELIIHTLFGDIQKYPITDKQRWCKDL